MSTFSVLRTTSLAQYAAVTTRWSVVETVQDRTFVVSSFRTEVEARAALLVLRQK